MPGSNVPGQPGARGSRRAAAQSGAGNTLADLRDVSSGAGETFAGAALHHSPSRTQAP